MARPASVATRVSHSQMQTFKDCRRKHYYAYILGVRREQSPALRFGSAYHHGLDVMKKGGTADDACQRVSDNYMRHHDMADAKMQSELVKVLALLRGWQHHWQQFGTVQYKASELKFSFGVGRNRCCVGMIDGIATDCGDEFLVEHKTTSESIDPASDYWYRLTLDSQISTYILAAQKLGYSVNSCLYDVTRKPGINVRRNESLEEYGVRLAEDIASRPQWYYQRRRIARTDAELAHVEWEIEETIIDIGQAEAYSTDYRNPASCRNPYPCPYLPVCTGQCDIEGDGPLPEGFVRTEHQHPELEEDNA